MELKILGLNTSYINRSCIVTAQLLEVTGAITKLKETLTFTIQKPYDTINDAIRYESAVLLHNNGYDVSIPDVIPEGILPEQNLVNIVTPQTSETDTNNTGT
jgi:hypothetical protein